jgi:NADH-quinone oxidoreductase subunit N
VIPLAQIEAPEIDYLQLAPLLSTVGGSVVVLMVGLVRGRAVQRVLMPLLTLASLVTALVFTIVIWEPGEVEPIVEGALRMDTLALGLSVLFYTAGIFTVLLSLRSEAVRATGAGEYFSLLLASVSGMAVLAAAESLITLFVGFELLSIPLYVLCGSHVRQERSLESGLKYLIIGSVGSATLLYGLALIYGATGATRFSEIATAAAAFAIFLRLFGDALIDAQAEYGEALAALAWVTIVIGNVGAIAQSSLKRMLAWSGVAQAGYMLVGVLVGTQLGLQATAFYLAVYLLMNVAAFAVVVARERVSEHGDGIRSLEGLGSASPLLAWPMTIAMLALAGFPLTAGFFGKFYLIEAAVEAGWESLGVAIVIGSMLSLVYYLRVVAVMWMGPVEVELPAPPERAPRRVRPVGGWSPEADPRAQPAPVAVAVVTAAATIALGIVPGILFDAAVDVGSSVGMPPL